MIWDERSAQIQQTNNNIKLKMQMPVETQLGDLSNTTPDFICKLYAMIKQHPQTISFSEDGSEVHIHDKEKFTTQILKKTFRHDKWRSFIRQMNMYNFRKVNRGMQTYIFVNNIFREGNQTNFYKIKRKINTKEQQMSTQNNLQQDLKILLKLQSQSLGITNNTTLLQFDLNKNSEVNSNRNSKKQGLKFDNDNQISNLNGMNRLENLPRSQNTLPSLSIFENRILGNNVNYTNSIIYFIQRAIKYRKQGEQLCGQIKQCMEYIAKERKTVQNKNILNTVKDSTQMIDEISNKFKQKIENYVDYKVSELQQNVQNFSNYLPNNSQENIGLNQNNNPPVPNGNFNIDLLEYISGHSFQNIPEPMSNRLYNPLMSPPTKIPQLSQVKLQDQQKKDSNFKIIKLQSKLNSKTLNNSGNIRLGNQTFSTSSINPIIPQPIPLINTRKQLNDNKKSVSFQNNASNNNNQNILGLTSQCSFSSLNLDKQ